MRRHKLSALLGKILVSSYYVRLHEHIPYLHKNFLSAHDIVKIVHQLQTHC